ncbi:hypothetical protein CRYO30217_00006 [Parvicella tangerina]|uniref:Uncharacterized protein n=2 Tax=Parvicella tangerina TaxID=2829795 RepID=A0A916JK21_9FLAO|nr:hypothetical protein CRYO30217_00006 [Parvicella tangerina]
MFQRFLRFMLSLILKGLKTKQMTNSIDDLIQRKVLTNLDVNYRATLSVNSSEISKVQYLLTFIDGKQLTFDLDYSKGSLQILFVSTDIIHMDILGSTILNLTKAIRHYEDELSSYFEIRMKSA